MKPFLICAILVLAKIRTIRSSISLSLETIENPIPIEKYVEFSFDSFEDNSVLFCDLYVFSLNPVNILAWNHPVVILSKSYRRVRLQAHCNIINIFTPVTVTEVKEYIDIVKKFVYRNFAIIQLVVIFLQQHQRASDFQEVSKNLRKDVIMIEHGGRNSTSYNYGLKFCRGNPKCILRHRVIKVGYNEIKPYFQVQGWKKSFPEQMPITNVTPENLDSIREKFSGIEAEMLKFIVENYEVSFTLIPCEFGIENPNGTWTGKLGLLSEKKLNMVIGSLPGNYRRGKIGKHSAQIFTIHFTLTSRKPEQLSSYQALLRPFPWTAWLILLISIAVVGPVTWWVTRKHVGLTKTKQISKRKNDLTVWRTCGNAALTLLVEPWKNPPRGPATFILSGWFLATLALQCLYSSNLIASLSFPVLQEPVKTFEDANRQRKTVLVKSSTTPALFLKNKNHPTLANFRLVHTGDEYGVIALENKTNVAAYDVNIFRFKMLSAGRKLKHYYLSPKPFLIIFAGWLYSQEFKLVEAIDTVILRAADAGLTEKWFEDQFLNGSGKNRIIKTEREERADLAIELKDQPLSMVQLYILFYFWLFGMSASIVAFTVELLLLPLNRYRNRICKADTMIQHSKQEYSWVYLE